MATDTKELILGWCSAADDLQLAGERSEPDTEYALALTSGGAEITVTLPQGGDRLLLTHRVDRGESATAVEGDLPFLEEQRPGPVSVSLDADAVRIGTWIVLDGLTKHSLLTAVSDLTRTRRAVLRLLGTAAEPVPAASPEAGAPAGEAAAPAAEGAGEAAAAEGWPAAGEERESGTETSDTAAASPAAWPGVAAGTAAQTGSAGSAEPAAASAQPWDAARTAYEGSAAAQAYGQPLGGGAAQPAPVPAGPAPWTPGHKVPPQGMQAWAAPDPNGAVIATLGGHLPVQVTEMRGAWAHVVCSNGWTGWVDGRLLVAGP